MHCKVFFLNLSKIAIAKVGGAIIIEREIKKAKKIKINNTSESIRFTLSAIRGLLLEIEREKDSKRVREREILGYYTRVTYYP